MLEKMNKCCLIIFLCFNFFLFSQEKKIEEIYQECAYNTLSDKGKAMKRYTKGFEKYLIKVKILKDSTSKSYCDLYKSFSLGKRYNSDNFAYAYSDSINKNKEDRLKIFPISNKCVEEIKKHKSFNIFKNDKLLRSNRNDEMDIDEIIKENLDVIEKRDFSLDYYKHRTFALLYLLDEY